MDKKETTNQALQDFLTKATQIVQSGLSTHGAVKQLIAQGIPNIDIAKPDGAGGVNTGYDNPQTGTNVGFYSAPEFGVPLSFGGAVPIGNGNVLGGSVGVDAQNNGLPFATANINGKQFLNQGISGEQQVPDFGAGYKAGINHLLQKVMPMLNPETGKMLVGAGLGLIGGAGVGGLVGAADAAGMGAGGAILGGWSGSPMNPMSSPPSNASDKYKVNLPGGN
jgi:hypothetical protein